MRLSVRTRGSRLRSAVNSAAVSPDAEAGADEPLKAFVIGAFVRGVSMRDVESLCDQAGLGKLSKSTASRMCEELKERFERFRRRDLYEIGLVALYLDATFIAVRPNGQSPGAWAAHRSIADSRPRGRWTATTH
jgi:hypothetical protein